MYIYIYIYPVKNGSSPLFKPLTPGEGHVSYVYMQKFKAVVDIYWTKNQSVATLHSEHIWRRYGWQARTLGVNREQIQLSKHPRSPLSPSCPSYPIIWSLWEVSGEELWNDWSGCQSGLGSSWAAARLGSLLCCLGLRYKSFNPKQTWLSFNHGLNRVERRVYLNRCWK